MITASTPMKRQILDDSEQRHSVELLQNSLFNLIDLALLLKQAHWNVVGKNFRSVHLQLDEVLETVREASDDVAERIAALGIPADGRTRLVSQHSELSEYPADFQNVEQTIGLVADAMKTTIDGMRDAIGKLGELDPVSEDLCIGISGQLEKHLWMVQAQEA